MENEELKRFRFVAAVKKSIENQERRSGKKLGAAFRANRQSEQWIGLERREVEVGTNSDKRNKNNWNECWFVIFHFCFFQYVCGMCCRFDICLINYYRVIYWQFENVRNDNAIRLCCERRVFSPCCCSCSSFICNFALF